MSAAERQYYLNSMGLTSWKHRYPQPSKNTSNIDWLIQHDAPAVVFLADWTTEQEFELLMAIVKACAKDKPYAVGRLMNAQNLALAPINVVFGTKEALKIAPDLSSEGVYDYGMAKIVVTYPLLDLQNNPSLKKELWKTWQSLFSSAFTI